MIRARTHERRRMLPRRKRYDDIESVEQILLELEDIRTLQHFIQILESDSIRRNEIDIESTASPNYPLQATPRGQRCHI